VLTDVDKMASLEAKVKELIKHTTGLKRRAVQLESRLREADAKLARHMDDSRRWEKEREWLRGRLRKILGELAVIEHREDDRQTSKS
jgi:chromosome segregation ATPase